MSYSIYCINNVNANLVSSTILITSDRRQTKSVLNNDVDQNMNLVINSFS